VEWGRSGGGEKREQGGFGDVEVKGRHSEDVLGVPNAKAQGLFGGGKDEEVVSKGSEGDAVGF
jgi:hypothetical protein